MDKNLSKKWVREPSPDLCVMNELLAKIKAYRDKK